MIASIVIIFFSAGMLAYWFRYTCILLVRNCAEEARSLSAAARSSFSFAEIQDRLCSAEEAGELDPLHRALERDYQVMTYLFRHASGLAIKSFEERLLVWDYKLMQSWYTVTKTAAPEQARQALREMASVLGILAGRIGQRAGLQSEA